MPCDIPHVDADPFCAAKAIHVFYCKTIRYYPLCFFLIIGNIKGGLINYNTGQVFRNILDTGCFQTDLQITVHCMNKKAFQSKANRPL